MREPVPFNVDASSGAFIVRAKDTVHIVDSVASATVCVSGIGAATSNGVATPGPPSPTAPQPAEPPRWNSSLWNSTAWSSLLPSMT